jgi:exodeoxyribonuclease V alpha subunit
MGGFRVAVAAPTGKAAVRVTESLAKAGVSGLIAKTIHSTLGVTSADGGWTFNHNEDSPLPFDYLFTDESSMIDTPLMASWMAARKSGACMLLVGDPGQLSPVGHGAPLRDLIAAGVPCGMLTEIMRNSGRIVKACHAIADKGRFEPAEKIDLEAGENLVHIERASPQTQIAELTGMLDRIRNGKQYDVFDDVQVLVPVNDKSPIGRRPLNKLLQGILNPLGEQAAGNPFRVGDKIINGRNGMVPIESESEEYGDDCNSEAADSKVYVANGEQARVVSVFANYTVAKLDNPNRLVRIPKGKSSEGNDGEGGEKADTGCNWDLAYAISTHKSQGSEWPIVIVMIDSYPGAVRLCTKEWLYTALSRGKEMVFTIGKKTVADAMCRRHGLWLRKTFLRETIEELAAQSFGSGIEMELTEV